MNYEATKFASLDQGLSHRQAEGAFTFAHPTKDGWQGEVSPVKDFLMTFFYFAMVCAVWGAFFWWLLA